jgi:hypothetical protein
MSEAARLPQFLPDDAPTSQAPEAPPPTMDELRQEAADALDCSGRKLADILAVLAFWAATDTAQHRNLLQHVARDGCSTAPRLAGAYWYGLSDERRTQAADQSASFLRLGAMVREVQERGQPMLNADVRDRVGSSLVVGSDPEKNRFQFPLM